MSDNRTASPPGRGGRYAIDAAGHRVLMEATKDHPEGNAARPSPEVSPAAEANTEAAQQDAGNEASAEALPDPEPIIRKRR